MNALEGLFGKLSAIPVYEDVPNLEMAQRIVLALGRAGHAACIAGGYVRDRALGRTPKDIDIVVVQTDYLAVKALLEAMPEDVIEFEYGASESQELSSDRLDAVFTFREQRIDVILYKGETLPECLELFDFNINQYVLIGNVPTFHGENLGVLTSVRPTDQLDATRITKMQRIARELGWEVP